MREPKTLVEYMNIVCPFCRKLHIGYCEKPHRGRLFHAVLAFERNSNVHKRLIGLTYPIVPKRDIVNARQRRIRMTSRVISVQKTWEPNTYIVETENSMYRVKELTTMFYKVYPFGLRYVGVTFVHTLRLHCASMGRVCDFESLED